MSAARWTLRTAALLLPLTLAGCSYLVPTRRKLPVPIAPSVVQTVTPQQLVENLNQQWAGLDSLTATVEIYATQKKSAEGVETSFPSCRGYIIISKPRNLRVAGTYFGVKLFDMASDGSNFTLVIPTKNTVVEGSNAIKEKSANELENLRPDFFFDAIVVRGLNPGEEFMVAGDRETVEDTAKKHLYDEPEYILSVMRREADSQQLKPVRQITFHRDDLRPYEQNLYDEQGTLETQILYANYKNSGAGMYPSQVTIKRPLEGIQLVLDVVRVQENVNLPPGEFDVKAPDGYTVRQLK
jgi:outer membrane lipoprotein-sorting protein